jgi:hypothetical protein
METAVDLLTGQEFLKKRINQRFSCPQNRIKYYNKKANEIRHTLFYINKPLYSNFRVLSEVMGSNEEAVFHKEYLKGKGINFAIHTHYENYEDKARTAIYNFILIALDNNSIKVIRKAND